MVKPVAHLCGYHAFREVDRVKYEANDVRKKRGNNGRCHTFRGKPSATSAIHIQMNEITSSVECNSDRLASGAMEEKAMAKKKVIR